MSKRAPQFERVPSDRYNTPLGAVLPLLPHLSDRTRFIESCCGEGDLVDHLTAAGHVCVGKYDLPVDARTAIGVEFTIKGEPYKIDLPYATK